MSPEDAVPPSWGDPVSRMGDLSQLGPHRSLCGDTLNAADMDQLMDGGRADLVFTDPPCKSPSTATFAALAQSSIASSPLRLAR